MAGFSLGSKRQLYFDPWYNSLYSAAISVQNKCYLYKLWAIIKGLWIAKFAMFSGMLNINKASSIIYIAQKRKI